MMELPHPPNEIQTELISQPKGSRIFLEGPAGAGKTTAAVARLLSLLDAGVSGESVLLLFPQRTLAEPYLQALRSTAATEAGDRSPASLLLLLYKALIDIFSLTCGKKLQETYTTSTGCATFIAVMWRK